MISLVGRERGEEGRKSKVLLPYICIFNKVKVIRVKYSILNTDSWYIL